MLPVVQQKNVYAAVKKNYLNKNSSKGPVIIYDGGGGMESKVGGIEFFFRSY